MASSYTDYKNEIKEYIRKRHGMEDTILDVGAGSGTYGKMLEGYMVDAVEVYGPNIDKYGLREIYRNVYNVDIRDFLYGWYDLVIFGDVLEHLDVEEAQEVLRYACQHSKNVIVAVPYLYKQGIEEGNVYEIHKQDDLTPEIMKERYPALKELWKNDFYGYYVRV